jgi:4-hydroxy-tetrahydrodipicolinate synthase
VSDRFPPKGIIGAALTPFADDSRVDHDALANHVRFLAAHCEAVSVLGAEVSEYRVLSPRDRREALTRAIQASEGRVPVVAGASHPSVDEVVRLSEVAAAAGADFIQVLIPVTPAGNAARTGDLVAYFEQVTARSVLPVVAYHNPPRGSDASAAVMVELARIDRVVAFKESSRDITKLGRLCAEIDEAGHARYYTTMQALLPTLALGGSGAMMPAPGTLIGAKVMGAFRRGDHEAAARFQRAYRLFPGAWGQYGLAPTMKAAMTALGHGLGGPARPFAPVPADEIEALRRHLTDLGVPELLDEVVSPEPRRESRHEHSRSDRTA